MSVGSTNGEDATTLATILVAQRGQGRAAALCKDLPSPFTLLPVDSLLGATRAVETNAIAGAILDDQLHGGDGFTLVDSLRQQNPSMPLLMICSNHDVDSMSRAHLIDVPLVHRLQCSENLKAFFVQVNTHRACARNGIEQILQDLIRKSRLSLRESQILTVAVHGIPRSCIAKRLGLSENTIKTQIRSLLDKMKKPNLSEVVWMVHSQTQLSAPGLPQRG